MMMEIIVSPSSFGNTATHFVIEKWQTHSINLIIYIKIYNHGI